MTVFIVVKNGNVDEVFDNREAAITHMKNLKWSIVAIVEKEVHTI